MIRVAVLLLILATSLRAQTTWTEPAAPRQGDAVTFFYDALAGTLPDNGTQVWMHWGILDDLGAWGTPPQEIWPAGSQLHSDNVALQSPMTNGGNQVWSVTVDFTPEIASIAYVFTDRGNNWDNNAGNNWELVFLAAGTVSWWSPADPEPGDSITIYYDAVAGTLPNGATNVILHWGVNEAGHGNWRLPPQAMWPAGTVPQGQAARTPLINRGNGLFSVTMATLDTINSVHYVTTDGTNWDNNNNQNWDIFMEEPPVAQLARVVFRFDPRSAFAQFTGQINSLNLAGAFNGWSTSATPLTTVDAFGNRWGEVQMPVGENEYKFVINGNNWQIDPDNPRNAPGGFNNSLLTVAADSLPQVYDIQPGEAAVFTLGDPETITCKVRGGDLGPGINGTPVVRINGAITTPNWNGATGQLSIALPTDLNFAEVSVQATDSAGRSATRYLMYYFLNSVLYAAPDVRNDVLYTTTESVDLKDFVIYSFANGDSLEIRPRFHQALTANTMAIVTITAEAGSYSAIEGLDAEYEVPGLAAGGVILPMLAPTSPNYDPAVHNRLHYGSIGGPSVPANFEVSSHYIQCYVAVADLEAALGNYQTEWLFSCASAVASSSADGYVHEISAAEGGTDGLEEPDFYDAFFFAARDIQKKNAKNYGLTRRATFDAPGRGLAAIAPEDIGPDVAHPGPLCRILTRGAETRLTNRTIKGRVTSTAALTSVWLMQNETVYPVTLAGDSFALAVTLTEGDNLFTLFARDMNSDTGRSAQMNYPRLVDQAPNPILVVNIGDATIQLNATSSTDPQGDPLTYEWIADPDNPAPVTLNDPHNPIATFTIPPVHGEYYFDLVVSDDEQNTARARTFVRVTDDGESAFQNNQVAEWVDNAVVYEIFVRSYSAGGDLDGVTADMQRIADLGVSAIWMMPIFEGPSDHGYEITDYYTIEQDYGTNEDLRELVEAAHAHGLKVVLDMVINHTGIGHPFMQDAQRYGRNSHYWDWYDRNGNGDYTFYYDWSSLPNINLDNPEASRYYIDMCKYWVEEFDIDGYRCDVAWGPMERSPQFWVDWRRELKKIKPEVFLLGEAGASDFNIYNERFDLSYDWALHHEGSAGFANMFPGIPNFTNLTDLITNYGFPWPEYKNPFRFIENHDESRYISIKTPAQTKLVSELLLSMPGVPMIYAGQEIGESSQRGLINWGSDPNGMFQHYYRLLNARKLLPAMRVGDWDLLTTDQPGPCYSFARTGEGMDPVIFLGNFSSVSQLVNVNLDADLLNIHPDSTYVVSDLLAATSVSRLGSELATLFTSLSAYSGRVWVISDSAIFVDANDRPELPRKTELLTPYPNPFNPVVSIPLELAKSSHVTLRVFDVLGRETVRLADDVMNAGLHQFVWDGSNASSGVYFVLVQADGIAQTRKIVLMK
ncbi:MAG: T9SS type A sorting domain-containing protein [bacterium]|nr:T9SS type A sorting domain-containing protein [bacterium]